jgi:hypothetical protein
MKVHGTVVHPVQGPALTRALASKGIAAAVSVAGKAIEIVLTGHMLPGIGNPESPIDQSLAEQGSGWACHAGTLDCNVVLY